MKLSWETIAQVRMEDGGSGVRRSGDADRFEKCLEVGVNRIYGWVWWHYGKEPSSKTGGLGVCATE